MLGNSSQLFNSAIQQIICLVRPQNILELGCGKGKFADLVKQSGLSANLKAIQRIFSEQDIALLTEKGYCQLVDKDILEYYREGFDENYDMIVALDVIEHFLLSDVISIINFSLYRADYMLLVWPSAHPQAAANSPFDRHRASFELRDLSSLFDVVFYAQTGFAQMHFVHRYHVALIRGFMNTKVLPPLGIR